MSILRIYRLFSWMIDQHHKLRMLLTFILGNIFMTKLFYTAAFLLFTVLWHGLFTQSIQKGVQRERLKVLATNAHCTDQCKFDQCTIDHCKIGQYTMVDSSKTRLNRTSTSQRASVLKWHSGFGGQLHNGINVGQKFSNFFRQFFPDFFSD